MKCSNCNGTSVKNGKQNGIQRYRCRNCHRSFQSEHKYRAYLTHVNDLIKKLLKESCGVRSISRIVGISTKTVLSRILKIADQIKIPNFQNFGCKFEVDELWCFIGDKNNVTWITYILEQKTKQVIDFIMGMKSKANIRPLIDKLLLLYPNRIYTDKLNIYPSLIPSEIHKQFKYCTNRIERMNLTLRTHIKRLSRRTICFSRKQGYLEAHLKIYFWG